MKLSVVVIGLSVTSSWGNGHAAAYRALLAALAQRGHSVTFLERDAPWYRDHRDLTEPQGWSVRLYHALADLPRRFGSLIRDANLVMIGSYVPDGIAIADWVTSHVQGITAFYDIDTPVTLAGLDQGRIEYISAALIPRFDLYLSFAGGPVPGIIEDVYGSPLARALYCSADLEPVSQRLREPRWSLGYLGTYSEDRQPQLQKLLLDPARALGADRFVIAGSKYPENLVWPANVDRIEHLAPSDHARFYADQRYTLNVTRADMRALGFSPSVRLFEAAACGTPIISDRWPGIETILEPSSEVLLASGPDEVIQIIRDLPEDRRLAIADNARRRIARDHTPGHRAQQLEAHYLEAIARRRSTTRKQSTKHAIFAPEMSS
jgi:spore maturation protein CgeB